MQRLDDDEHLRTGYPVVNRCPLAASLDQPVGPQSHELLRHRHLIDVQEFSQLSHGPLLVAECAQHEQPLRVGEAPKQFDSLSGGRDHIFYIHTLEFIIFEC